MIWSKLKKRIKDNIIPELKNRIDIHFTRYHHAHDGAGEIWITIDKEKIIGGGVYHWYTTKLPENISSKEDFDIEHGIHKDFFSLVIENEDVFLIMNSGIHNTYHFTENLENYINTNYDVCLKSNNPIFKAIALVDKRLGKRRFNNIKLNDNDHILVKSFYNLRKEVFNKKSKNDI